MPNLRVYEFSKEVGLSNKDVIEIANKLGISVRSHTSSISDEDAKKIRENLKTPNPQDISSSAEEDEKTDEKVKVFRSESGEEVFERRKGRSVILRKKKKAGEPDVRAAQLIEEGVGKAVDKTPAETQLITPEEVSEETREIETEIIEEQPIPESEAGRETIPEQIEVQGLRIEEAKEEAKRPEGVGEKEVEEEKVKKKGRKVKPKREEIIDEDTLEELRRAFKTKLPGRKREYLVEDRRSRVRPLQGSLQREKPSLRIRKDYAKDIESGKFEAPSAEIIPFPRKPIKKSIKLGDTITVGGLAKKMGVKVGEVIKRLMDLGAKYTVNQSIDHETAAIVAEELGFEVTVDKFEEDELLFESDQEVKGEYVPRPPIVTVMGHVDHGKTTLLDTIRKANVVAEEMGGITQHIGAYCVSVDERKVVFVDTPGHEAFTAMRARGANVTDIVILVVAADDGVMPQTVEAVNHARAAGVPIIVAINKVDKPESNPDMVKRQLSDIGLIPEEWGGDTLFAEISAKTNVGIKELLELVLLQADVMELKAIEDKRAIGAVIEAELSKGRGPLATIIVNEGTIRVGDYVIAGTTYGRVRALIDDKGNREDSAGPSLPVEVMGLSGVPSAGERLYVVKDEKTAKELVTHREIKERQRLTASKRKLSLEDLFESIQKEEVKELLLIIKADTQGSVEAIKDAVSKLSTDKCRVNIVHSGVGAINETDVTLAVASNAIVLGFNVRPDVNALSLAEKEGVSTELHTIIYDAVDRIKKAMEGLLEPVIKERVLAHAEVRATFTISKIGTIAGCIVTDGKVSRGNRVRLLRDGVLIYEGKLSSLKRFKDDIREVQTGFECGIGIENFNDIKVADTLEFYDLEEIKQQL
ncbi:MAG TPA: translation initiation factor IF-2 [Thermodesulfobacteriota bacterium]